VPTSAEKSRRVERCCFIESGRRCRKSGTGDPALCNAHRVLLADAARQGAKPRGARAVGDGIYNLVDRLVSGKKVTRKMARDAFDDARDILEELKTSGWSIPAVPPGTNSNGHANGHRRTPPDPEAARRAEKQRACARARQTLGFGPQDPLTEALIKGRQRELAKKHHPDLGGSVSKMAAINDAADVLLSEL